MPTVETGPIFRRSVQRVTDRSLRRETLVDTCERINEGAWFPPPTIGESTPIQSQLIVPIRLNGQFRCKTASLLLIGVALCGLARDIRLESSRYGIIYISCTRNLASGKHCSTQKVAQLVGDS